MNRYKNSARCSSANFLIRSSIVLFPNPTRFSLSIPLAFPLPQSSKVPLSISNLPFDFPNPTLAVPTYLSNIRKHHPLVVWHALPVPIARVNPKEILALEWIFHAGFMQPINFFEIDDAVSREFHLGPPRPPHILGVVLVGYHRLGGGGEDVIDQYWCSVYIGYHPLERDGRMV